MKLRLKHDAGITSLGWLHPQVQKVVRAYAETLDEDWMLSAFFRIAIALQSDDNDKGLSLEFGKPYQRAEAVGFVASMLGVYQKTCCDKDRPEYWVIRYSGGGGSKDQHRVPKSKAVLAKHPFRSFPEVKAMMDRVRGVRGRNAIGLKASEKAAERMGIK